jgi:hypothetical protein
MGYMIIRPLLFITREAIEKYIRDNRLHPNIDSSNAGTDYTRNKIRNELIPYLEKNYNPNIREALRKYAMSAEMFGMKFFYIEAGSGASEPIPPEMVAYTKKATENMIVVVGGGIRDAKAAYTAAKAGGDIIVTGTVVEDTDNVLAKIQELTGAIKKASME